MMKNRLIAVAILVLAGFASAAHSSYPTTWSVKNLTPQMLAIECVNHANGLGTPIIFKMEIEQRSMKTYVWSGWYNDGLGLNPGNWRCSVNGHQSEFNSGWGENIIFELNE